MPVGKDSIKRAASAGKKAAAKTTAAKPAAVKAASEKPAAEKAEVKTSVIAAPAVEIAPECTPVRVGEELPIYLL